MECRLCVGLTLVALAAGLGACGGDDDENVPPGLRDATTQGTAKQTATAEERRGAYVSLEEIRTCIEGEGLDVRPSGVGGPYDSYGYDVVELGGDNFIDVVSFGDSAEAKEYVREQKGDGVVPRGGFEVVGNTVVSLRVLAGARPGGERELAIVKKCARG